MAVHSAEQSAHSTKNAVVQSKSEWVGLCEEEFEQAGLPPPCVHQFDGQELSVPQFKTLYEYWCRHPEIDGARVIEKIDPLGFREALGDVMLVEPLHSNTDFRYRLFGTAIASRLGEDMTGRNLSDLPAAPYVRQLILRSNMAAVNERCAYLTKHVLPDYVSTENWRRLTSPVCNPDGAITLLLVCTVPGKRRYV